MALTLKPTKPPKINELLDTLEEKLDILRNEYEQFFLGFVKREPIEKRGEVSNLLQQLARLQITNTAYKFKLNQLTARFVTLSQRWNRTLHQIEEGTFHRDHFRVRLREGTDKAKSAPRPAPSPSPTPPPPRDSINDTNALSQLYQDFLQVRTRCKERTDNVQFDKMVDFMKKQTETIKSQYKCTAVKFEVIEDGGKAKLKAIPIQGLEPKGP